MKLNQTSVLCLASFVLSLSASAAFTRLATETYPGGGGGPTGGVSKAYVDAHDLATLNSAKTYTDASTNALDTALRSALAATAASSTNYTDASTLAATNFVKAKYLPLDGSKSMTGNLEFESDKGITLNGNGSLTLGGDSGSFITGVTRYEITSGAYIESGSESEGAPLWLTFGNLTKTSAVMPDGTPVVTSNMLNGVLAAYQTNLVVSASTADKVLKNDGTTLYWGEGGGGGGSPLAGAQYNFHNGTNFTWTIYATLTNALVKMGATVTNPPALDESALVHPIVVTASTSTGSPLAGKTYDFHSGANFVKDVYQVLEQAVRDLGATTVNTPTF